MVVASAATLAGLASALAALCAHALAVNAVDEAPIITNRAHAGVTIELVRGERRRGARAARNRSIGVSGDFLNGSVRSQEKFTRTGHRGTQTNKPRHNSFGPFGLTTFTRYELFRFVWYVLDHHTGVNGTLV